MDLAIRRLSAPHDRQQDVRFKAGRPGVGDCERDAGASGRAQAGGRIPGHELGSEVVDCGTDRSTSASVRAPVAARPRLRPLRFQSTQRQAWLVELDVNAARTQGDLCQRHAAALVLPRGWELHDERAPGAWTPVASEARTDPAPKNGKTARRARAKRNGAADATDTDAELPGFQPARLPRPNPGDPECSR